MAPAWQLSLCKTIADVLYCMQVFTEICSADRNALSMLWIIGHCAAEALHGKILSAAISRESRNKTVCHRHWHYWVECWQTSCF